MQNSGISRRIDGSYTGRTFPVYFDSNDEMGELQILRLQGKEGKALPVAPFLIRKSIQRFLGGNIDSAFKEGGGRTYALKVRNSRHFNRLLAMTKLDDGTPIEIVEHPTHNSTRCMVFCRDSVDMPLEEIEEELKEQGIIKVHRITKRVGDGRQNTPLLVCTVRGTVRPESIYFGFDRIPTRPYYPMPMQCFNCWAFGHTKLRCKASAPVCGNCAGTHALEEGQRCTEEPYCSKCDNNSHSLRSRSCPDFVKENQIQKLRVDYDCSYNDAKKMFLEENRSDRPTYAQVANRPNIASVIPAAAKTVVDNSEEFRQINSRIDKLITVIENRDQRIAALEASFNGKQAPSTLPPSVEELLAKQEEKHNLQMDAIIKQNEYLRETNLKLHKELKELRQVLENRQLQETTIDEMEATSDANDPILTEILNSIESSPAVSPDNSPNPSISNLRDTPRPINKSPKSNPPNNNTTPKRAASEVLLQRTNTKKKKELSGSKPRR